MRFVAKNGAPWVDAVMLSLRYVGSNWQTVLGFVACGLDPDLNCTQVSDNLDSLAPIWKNKRYPSTKIVIEGAKNFYSGLE